MKKRLIVHPILFALFPPTFLLGVNFTAYDLTAAVKPVYFSAVVAVLLWLFARLWTTDADKISLFVSLSIIFFYLFGSLYVFYGGSALWYLVLYPAMAALILRPKRCLQPWSYLMNVIGVLLVALPLSNIVMQYSAPAAHAETRLPAAAASHQRPLREVIRQPPVARPDIYYVVLDAYGGSDMLKEIYQYDNSEFLDYLRQKGFFVAEASRSNYPQTKLTLASVLNMSYVNDLLPEAGADSVDQRFTRALIRDNQVTRFLKDQGYSSVAFESQFYDANLTQADIQVREWWFLNLFEITNLQMTPFPWVLQKAGLSGLHDLHRARILHSFEKLPGVADLQGPKFVFVHILAGHPPFVFGEDGEPVTPDRRYSWQGGAAYMKQPGASREEYRQGYNAQLTYMNRRLREVLDDILARSETPPIVILQGDHGPGSGLDQHDFEKTDLRERFSILNALHLPGGDPELYHSISPVNTFRLIFNRYFGADFEILEDNSYFSHWDTPFEFVPVPAENSSAHKMASQR